MKNPEKKSEHGSLRVGDYLREPARLRETLDSHGVFSFPSYATGLFPASDLSPEKRAETGMGMAWFRDNAHVAFALHEDGRTEEAARVGSAFLTILHNNRPILTGEQEGRLPVRVEGDTLANDHEHRIQNDSVGYALWLTSRLMSDGALDPTPEDLDVLANTVGYLRRVEYWHDADEGHWEEDRRVHASSIGVVLAGLEEARTVLERDESRQDIDFDDLMTKGMEAFHEILGQGVTDISSMADDGPAHPGFINPATETADFLKKFSVHKRRYDAAMLFLVEPLRILNGEWAGQIVEDVESELVRPNGTARYAGDTYWEPRFPDIMSIEERTSQAEGRTEKRNLTAAGVAYTGTEAQWTLFDPVLSTYWGRRFQETGSPEHREKQLLYLDRSLAALTPKEDGNLALPESYFYHFVDGENRWISNDHTPLLWSQANLLRAVRMFEETA